MSHCGYIVVVVLYKIVVLRKEELVGACRTQASTASGISKECIHARIGSPDSLRELEYRG